MRLFEFDKQYITKDQLSKLEYYLDLLYAQNGVDVEFTRHFLDRVNDERNGEPITIKELVDIFTNAQKIHGDKLSHSEDGWQAVLKDVRTDINSPFALQKNKKNGKIDLIAKTVMRKKNFKSPDPILKVY